MKKLLKILGIILLAVIMVVVGYLGYVWVTYDRIEDNQELSVVDNAASDVAETGKEYTIVTQNIGFGAYTADFTFFMDGGEQSRAVSAESVNNCINKGIEVTKSVNPDIVMFQEVDLASTRSFKIDQSKMIQDGYKDFDSTFAINYDSAYLMYPLNEPHGRCYAGIMTLSDMQITSGLRRSLKISESFSKLVDLDRCYSKSRIPVENGKELVVYNVHLSAYGGTDEIRNSQMTQLSADMYEEYQNGNYVVCGGDFNTDFTGDSVYVLNPDMKDNEFGWAQPFLVDLLPEGLHRCVDYSIGSQMPSCRNCDIPYEPGNFTVIVDGFIISDNVEMTYLENIQTGFEYSDHNPVVMRFVLKEE